MPGPLNRFRDAVAALGLGKRPTATDAVPFSGGTAPSPARPVHVVGDLHGCLSGLERILDAIGEDVARQGWDTADLVFVGDYIDRGPDSLAVLERLQQLQGDAPDRVHCLRGNHEAMFLNFLEAPEQHGPVWLRNGGHETLISFGQNVPLRLGAPGVLAALAADARAALPADLLAWIAARPLTWHSGDLVAVHAALDPALPLADQPEDTCLWGHAGFEATPRGDGLWVVHGHRITVPPVFEAGRISVDTGVVARGELTCAALAPGAPIRFLSVTAA